MQVKSFWIKDLSRSIKVLKFSNKKELNQELSVLTPDISELTFESWAIENFIPGSQSIFSQYLEITSANSIEMAKIKDLLYKAVLTINTCLNPKTLYINSSNTIVTTKTPIKLIECKSWGIKEDLSNLLVVNIEDFFELIEESKAHDHKIVVKQVPILSDLQVRMKVFNKSLKSTLLYGFSPKTEDDVKYIISAICTDNLPQILEGISRVAVLNNISFHQIIHSLFELSIQCNPFLNVKLKDFIKINSKYEVFRSGTMEEGESPQTSKTVRRSLQSVPKKDVEDLSKNLKLKIFGHDETIDNISKVIKRAYLGLKDSKTPIGAFFFYGGTSTGKTELAKVLSKLLTKSRTGLVKIACNTLTNSHNLHTLLGAPPGYVGYEEKGLLERGFSDSSFKILLFDEIEKASTKIYDILLEALEEGELLLANGNTVNLQNSIIIFTSNIGQQQAIKSINAAGFASDDQKEESDILVEKNTYEDHLKQTLKPEFISRLNGIYYFPRLTDQDLANCAKNLLNKYIKQLKKKELFLSYSEDLISFILDQIKNKYKIIHARNIRNYIDMEIISLVADKLTNLPGKVKNYEITLYLKNNNIQIDLKNVK